MSQAGLIDIESSHPQIPTQFDTDSGTAIPISNVLNVLGDGVDISTSGAGNTITITANAGIGAVLTLSDTADTTVSPDGAGNIQLESSDASITITSDAGNNKIDFVLPDGPDTATSNIIVYGGGNFASGYKADYDNITDAVAAASAGDTIFIKEGTYTESITVTKKLNFVAYGSSTQQGNVTISGKWTISAACLLKGLILVHSGDYTVSVSANTTVIDQCIFPANTSGAMECSAGEIKCKSVEVPGGKLYNGTGGNFKFFDCRINATSAASTNSASDVRIYWSEIGGDQTLSGTASVSFFNCNAENVVITTADTATVNAFNTRFVEQTGVFLTTSGTASNRIDSCQIFSGAQTSITVGAGTTVECYNTTLYSSNTDVIDGAGTLIYGGLTFPSTSSNISTTTKTIKNEGPSRYIGSTNVGNTNELSVRNLDNTNTSSNALVTVTSGGASGGNASYRACVSGAGCYHWGIDNSDDKLKVASGDTYLSGNTLLTMDTVGNSTFGFATAGNTIAVTSENSDNTNANSHSKIEAKTGGASGGDPYFSWNVDGVTSYSYGIDNTDSDKLKITTGNSGPSSGTTLLEMTTAGDTSFLSGDLDVTRADSGASVSATVSNTSDTASSFAYQTISVAGTSAADPYVNFNVSTTRSFSLGIDNSSNDELNINTNSTALVSPSAGTNLWKMTTAGECTMPLQPAFLAYLASADSNVTGNGTAYMLGSGNALTEVFDQNSDFVTTGTFTAPVTGRYLIGAKILFSGLTANTTYLSFSLITSNRTYNQLVNPGAIRTVAAAANFASWEDCQFADMDSGDTFTVNIAINGEASDVVDINAGTTRTNMFGYLAC